MLVCRDSGPGNPKEAEVRQFRIERLLIVPNFCHLASFPPVAAESSSSTVKGPGALVTMLCRPPRGLANHSQILPSSLTPACTPWVGRKVALPGCISRNNRQQLETYCPNKEYVGYWIRWTLLSSVLQGHIERKHQKTAVCCLMMLWNYDREG